MVTAELGLDEVMAEVLPDQKAAAVKRLQGEGRIVAMAGTATNPTSDPGRRIRWRNDPVRRRGEEYSLED